MTAPPDSSPEPDSVVPAQQFDLQSADADRLFHRLVWSVSALMSLYVVVRLVLDQGLSRAIGPLIIAAGGAVAVLIRRNGHLRASFVFYVWLIWFALGQQAIARTGMANPALHGYVVLMLLGGWLLGVRHAVALGVASIVATLLMALATDRGWWTPLPPTGPYGYWLALTVVWATGLVMMSWIVGAHWRSVQKISEMNRSLLEMAELRERQHAALRDSDARFATMVEASPVPIAISRAEDGRYLEVNPAWARVFGWSRDESIGRTSLELGFWPDANARSTWLSEFRRDGRSYGTEIDVRTRSGQELTMLLSAELIDFQGGHALIAILVDVTERKRIAAELYALNESLERRVDDRTQELEQSNAALREAMDTLKRAQEELVHSEKLASLGQLVAGVAHELNTPIGNALTAVSTLEHTADDMDQLIASGAVKRSQLVGFVEHVRDGASLTTRSLRRASDLLASFKQVAIDQASERRRRFDLRQNVLEVVDTLRPTLRGMPWTIEVDVPPGLEMESYPGALDQILINLIMNATIHGFESNEPGTITLDAKALPDGQIALSCRDNGKGIPRQHLGRVFDPFFTSRLGNGGSGLGLAITHRLTTQVLGGQVSVESEPGAGACFTLQLPRVAREVVV